MHGGRNEAGAGSPLGCTGGPWTDAGPPSSQLQDGPTELDKPVAPSQFSGSHSSSVGHLLRFRTQPAPLWVPRMGWVLPRTPGITFFIAFLHPLLFLEFSIVLSIVSLYGSCSLNPVEFMMLCFAFLLEALVFLSNLDH